VLAFKVFYKKEKLGVNLNKKIGF